jgi:hypothetical protein
MYAGHRLRRTWIAPLLLAAALAPTAAAAQEQERDTSSSIMREFVSARSEDDLRLGMERARSEEEVATRAIERARDLRTRTRTRVEIKKADNEALKQRAELAKKETRADDQTDLENRRRRGELERGVLEKLVSLYEAEMSEAESRRDWERATAKVYEAELALMRKRAERNDRAGDASADSRSLVRLDDEAHELEKKLLEARREEASKQASWADRHKTVIDRELGVYREQEKLRGSRR